MPPLVVAFAAWAGVSVAAGYLIVATVVLSAGMAVYGSAQARRAERKARDDLNASMKDRMVTRIATESPHRYIYGRAKVGADIVAMFTSGPRDEFKHLVCVHAAHECDAIEEIYVNNVAVGMLDIDGDATGGRFATDPYVEVMEETVTAPTFTLARHPLSNSIWVFAGEGAAMTKIPVSSVSGRTVTVAYTGVVRVSYEYGVSRKFDNVIDTANPPEKTPVVRVQAHRGVADDVADAYLRSILPDKWPATAVLRGMCYTVITLDLNHPEFQGGLVPIHAVIRGRKLYDPRTGLTAWSQNPALVIRDYLTSPLCGVPATDLPTAQFIAAANVCDEAIAGLGARYTLNGTVTSDQTQSTVLEAMAQAMAGSLVSTTWDIYAGKYIAPVAALTQEDIVGGLSVTPGVSDASVYNGVKGQYIGPENKYVQTDFKPYQNSAYRVSDGRDLYTNLDFPFTETLQRVTNLARIFTEDQRNGFTIKAEFSLKAWPRKVGERITFTSPTLGQTAKVYRITDKSYSPNSAVQLTLKEDAASIWDFADAVVVDSTPNSDLPDPWKIDSLTALTCTSGEATLLKQADGSVVPRILVSWPATVQASGVQVEIEWRAVSSPTWNKTSVSATETQAYLSPITPGFFYVVRARCYNPYLNAGSYWTMTAYQVQVFTARPVAYKWSADQPATPSGAGSYAWGAGTYGAPSGWTITPGTPPAGGGVSLWVAGVPLSDLSVSGSTAFDWAKAQVASLKYSETPAGAEGFFSPKFAWEFRGVVDGWIVQGTSGNALTPNADTVTATCNGTDVRFRKTGLGINGTLYDKVRMRVRRLSGVGSNWRMYYTTVGGASPHSESTSYRKDIAATVGTDWTVLEWDMSALTAGGSDWITSTNITALRIELANGATVAGDQFEIDWVVVGKYGPPNLLDLGFTGDTNATYGAPNGSMVGGTLAETVAANANAGAANATLSLAAIDSMRNDNVLDPSEKPAENARWSAITGERAGIDAQAAALGITTERTDYGTKFTSLQTYINGLGVQFTTIPGVGITIVGTTYRSMFLDYYNARQTLLNKIAAIAATAPGVIIGGANLLPDGDFERSTRTFSSRTGIATLVDQGSPAGSYSGAKALFFDGTAADMYVYLGDQVPVTPGQSYGVSFQHKTAGAVTQGSTFLRRSDGVHDELIIGNLNAGTWLRHEQVWTCPAGVTWVEFRAGIKTNGGYSWMGVDEIKIEKGNKVTAFTRAQVDIDAGIALAATTATWLSVSGAGRPQDNATVGAPAGSLVAGVAAETVANAAGAILDSFTVGQSGSAGGSYPNSSGTTYGTLTALPAGGRAPYKYSWTLSVQSFQNNGRVLLSSTSTQSVVASGSGTNSEVIAVAVCQITDTNNRSATVTFDIVATHGTPPL